jgi:hypothetical protein
MALLKNIKWLMTLYVLAAKTLQLNYLFTEKVANIIWCDFSHQSKQSFEHTTEEHKLLVKIFHHTVAVILVRREFRVKLCAGCQLVKLETTVTVGDTKATFR